MKIYDKNLLIIKIIYNHEKNYTLKKMHKYYKKKKRLSSHFKNFLIFFEEIYINEKKSPFPGVSNRFLLFVKFTLIHKIIEFFFVKILEYFN